MKQQQEENYEELEYINQLQMELDSQNQANRKLHNAQLSLFGGTNDENLIKWQLDLREDLERIYHLLRGDQIKEDEKGNSTYVPAEDDNLKPFNEFGTQVIMNIMSFYMNRNTILSNYDDETINWKVLDFSTEISDLIFNRYEEMMMTTNFEKEFNKLYKTDVIELTDGSLCIEIQKEDEEPVLYHLNDEMIKRVKAKLDEHLLGKMKMYPMIIRELVDSVHSSYLRAWRGLERDSLRTARTVTQSDVIGRNQGNMPVMMQPRKRSMFNPLSWFKS